MLTEHRRVIREINGAIAALIRSGLADDQNPAYESQVGASDYLVRYSSPGGLGLVPRNTPYSDIYRELRRARSFNALMLDGAMLQMEYEFRERRLVRHRLAFLPSPDLLEYQNNPEIYMQERMYADVVEKGVVTVPCRFDYDSRDGVAVGLDHPVSHLTLGQYSECRIPVSAGVTPHAFVDFVLRSFYNTASSVVDVRLPKPLMRFEICITAAERRTIHVGIPTHTEST
ncbi:MAG: DUF2290 domain-containing protein [Acidimicrobiia bacterium]|nr:DUF2290 domain-containing protein [Acidimicrobiia bacterium]MYJ14090.1 DUF2290 domain-containing protein [Acidimicrobiia bacterium]